MKTKPKVGLSLWLVLLVVTAVVPLLLFAGATLFQISKDSQVARDQGQADTARALALAVDGEVRSWKAALTALAGSRTLRDGRLAEFYDEAREVAAPHGGWIVLTVSSGQQIINTLRPYGTPLPMTSSPETINAIFATGKPLVSDVFYGKVAQGYLVAVAVPVVRAGTVVNCLTLNFYPQRLTRLLEGQQFPASWVAAINDRQHQVIARSRDIEKRVGKPVMPWLAAAEAAAEHGIATGPLIDGRLGQAAFQRLQEVPWVVTLAVPVAELPSSQPLVLFLLGGIVVGAGAVGAALYTGRRITAPVARLAQASERLLRGETGDLGAPSDIREVRELQQALGEASAAVQGYYQERERAAIAVETAKVATAAEMALRASEQRVRLKLDSILSPEGDLGNLELADILDVPAIQSLLENFFTLAHMPVSVVDLKGRVLVGVGWQEICTRFHRVHPDACRHCLESDTRLSAGVPPGEFRLYKCKNNMWDVATPIMVGGHHVGNLFSGQFFFEGEPPEQERFRVQAGRYGFPEAEYIQALESVPRMSRESLETGMAFFMKLAHMLSQLSYSNLKLARSLAERDALMQSLRSSEERLRQQREWLRVTLTSIGDAVLTTDTAGRITFLNPVAERLTGWRQDDALGRPVQSVLRIVDEGTREPAEDIVARVLREGRTVLLANLTALVARDGREWPIEDSAAPIMDSGGVASGVVVVFHDVTEKRRAQTALRESEDRLRLALESAELGTWDFDPVTGSLNWSDRCKALYGLPADARVDYATFLERLHPDDCQRTHDLVQQAIMPGGSGRFDAEYRVRWPGGAERWILAGGRAFFGTVNARSCAIRFIGTVLDITARKQAEEDLHQAHTLLEQRVRERTAELSTANQALAHRSDQLRNLAAELTLAEQRERKRLATVLHDEHQQLLVAAKLRVGVLDRLGDARVQEVSQEIAALLEEAIENSRSLTRELSPPVSLTGGLAPAVDWLARWMEQKYHLAVEAQVDETALPAGEELTAFLFQAMRELLFNVVKHTTVQTTRIEIARSAGQLRLSVSDSGGGFDPRDLRIEGGRGGGFGLFSIRQRVELLGGRMEIDSAYGLGSRFTLWVPLRPEPAVHPAAAPVPKWSGGEQGDSRS